MTSRGEDLILQFYHRKILQQSGTKKYSLIVPVDFYQNAKTRTHIFRVLLFSYNFFSRISQLECGYLICLRWIKIIYNAFYA